MKDLKKWIGGKEKRSKNFDKGDFNEDRKGEGKDRKGKCGKRGKKEEYKGEWRKEKIVLVLARIYFKWKY